MPNPLYPDEPSETQGNQQHNFNAAMDKLQLNSQEQALYMRHLKNLWGKGGVDNPDGSRSSLYVGTYESDGKHYVIPSVYDGKILSEDEAWNKAKSQGLDKFPSYNSQEEARSRYDAMHKFMEQDTREYFNSRGR